MRPSLLAVLPLLVGCIQDLPDVADPCATWADPDLYRMKMDGQSRHPLVYVPGTAGPRPAVFILHGGGSSAQQFRQISDIEDLADELGFVAVIPQGKTAALSTTGTWNAGDCCPPASNQRVDDVGYLDAVASALEDRVCVDRVLAAGFSNGGMMAMRWGCEGTQADAVVSAAGPLMVDRCQGEPVPLRVYHGTSDAVVPYAGGPSEKNPVNWPSVDDTLGIWREHNTCLPDDPQVETLGTATCQTWSCGADTTLCTLENWGHRWPGGNNARAVGFDATRDAWQWFNSLEL